MNPINLIIMLILISLLVLVHEWGHYIAARIFGVRVSKFGFGMPIGPVLFKKKVGDLEILVHYFLLGGYVSFPEDEENENNEPLLPLDSPERFRNKKPYQQAIILSAGVMMNVIFAFLLIILAASIFHKLPMGKTEVFVDGIVKDSYIAKTHPEAFQKGDKISKVNGMEIDSSYKFIFLVQNSKQYDGHADKNFINQRLEDFLKLNPSIDKNKIIPVGTKVILPKPVSEKPLVVKNMVASGLEKYDSGEVELTEDEIQLRDEIKGRRTYVLTRDSYALEIATVLSDTYKPLNFEIIRNNKIIKINNIKVGPDGTLGIKLASNEIYTPTDSVSSILINSTKYMYTSTKLMIYGLWQLISGKIPMSEMHGIIAITKIGTDIIAQKGMLNGLLLTAIISIDLALINLLPIPSLDGGHLMFLAIEKIRRRPLDEKTVENISKVFFSLLIALMIFVLLNDVWALITKKF